MRSSSPIKSESWSNSSFLVLLGLGWEWRRGKTSQALKNGEKENCTTVLRVCRLVHLITPPSDSFLLFPSNVTQAPCYCHHHCSSGSAPIFSWFMLRHSTAPGWRRGKPSRPWMRRRMRFRYLGASIWTVRRERSATFPVNCTVIRPSNTLRSYCAYRYISDVAFTCLPR